MKLVELIDWYNRLTPQSIDRLRELYHEQARFRDPFNTLQGHEEIEALFRHMFEVADSPRFHVTYSQLQGSTAWVSWDFHMILHRRPVTVEGVTRLDFGDDGRVVSHRDYWDSAELFLELPLLGTMTRLARRRLRLPESAIRRTNDHE
ncbi:MAG: nuclear transport factor 2 family protein [Sedimenticola sp.]|nr:nuclear transport factor 2 family protein [Sedimenticola sp.]